MNWKGVIACDVSHVIMLFIIRLCLNFHKCSDVAVVLIIHICVSRFMSVLVCLVFSVLSTIEEYKGFANETLFWMVRPSGTITPFSQIILQNFRQICRNAILNQFIKLYFTKSYFMKIYFLRENLWSFCELVRKGKLKRAIWSTFWGYSNYFEWSYACFLKM